MSQNSDNDSSSDSDSGSDSGSDVVDHEGFSGVEGWFKRMKKENEALREEKLKAEAEALADEDPYLDKKGMLDKYSYLFKYPLFYFNLWAIPNDASFIVCGRRRSGKTFLQTWIMYTKRMVFPHVMLQTSTKYNGEWQQHVAKDDVWKGFNVDGLAKLTGRQETLLEENPEGEDPRTYLGLDDIISDNAVRHNPLLSEFFYAGRHLKSAIGVNTQWFKALPPGCRENSDFVFLYSMINKDEIDGIYEAYAGDVPRPIFDYLVKRNSRNYSCLVINPHGRTPFERFFVYMAQKVPPFRMGMDSDW